MPDLATRIAVRHTEAGVFEGPPAMYKSISKWMLSLYAGNVLAYAQGRIAGLTQQQKLYEGALRRVNDFEDNIDRILKKLKPGEVHRVPVGVPTDPFVIGVKKVDQGDDRYDFGGGEMDLFQVGTGKSRLKFKKWDMYEADRAAGLLRVQLGSVGNHYHALLKSIRSGLSEFSESNLVELHLIAKAASQYTTKAKAYKTKSEKKIPVDLTGWKYLTPKSPYITSVNEEIFKRNSEIQEQITNFKVNLVRAQKLYDDLKSGKQALVTSIREQRDVEAEYNISSYRGDPWNVGNVMSAFKEGKRPSEKTTEVNLQYDYKGHWITLPEAEKVERALDKPITQGDINGALAAQGWGHIDCTLWFIWHKRRGGQWNFYKKHFEVDVRNAHPSTVKDFEDGLWEIQRVIRHETQHVGQDLLRIVKQLREDAGLPAEGVRTKDTDPMGHKTTGPGRGKRIDHAQQDVEYQTRLGDSIDRFEKDVRRKRPDQRRDFLRTFVGLGGIASDESFRAWQRENKEKWKDAIKKLMAEMAKRGIEIPGEGLGRIAGGKRTLYHIGKRPASPKPHKSGGAWSRAHGKIKEGVFLSSNPAGIWTNHGIKGNVYSYDVPEWVIAESGGAYRYDWGTEVVIPTAVWDKAGKEIRFKGKVSEKKFAEQVREVSKEWSRRNPGLQYDDPLVTNPPMKGWQTLLWTRQRKPKDPRKVLPLLKPGECQGLLDELNEWMKDRDNQSRGRMDRPGFARIEELQGLLTECAMTDTAQRVARRYLASQKQAAIKNDPAAVPPVGTRVLDVSYDTKYDPMADITFEDGRTLSVHLHMTPTTPGDSDTEAWQEREMAKLQDEESVKTIQGLLTVPAKHARS